LIILAALMAVAGCHDSDSRNGISASFVPAELQPGAKTVSLAGAGVSGDLVTIRVNLTDVDRVYSVAFDLVYDFRNVTFVSWTPGIALEGDGTAPFYEVAEPYLGRLVVGITRSGDVPGIDVVGSRHAIELTFRVTGVGHFPIDCEAGALFDDQSVVGPIPGVEWFGGTIVGR